MSSTASDHKSTAAFRDLQLTRSAFDIAAEAMFTVAPSGQILDANRVACERLEYSREELLGMTVSDVDPIHPPELWHQHFDELRRVKRATLETKHQSKSGTVTDVEVSVAYFEFEGEEYCCSSVRDITHRKRAEQLTRLQHDVLAKVASTSGMLTETLHELCRLVEEMVPDSIVTIMEYDRRDQDLRLAAGNDLPEAIRAALDRIKPGEWAGSCGAAAFYKKAVIVEDTSCSRHWERMQEIIDRFGLRACWSFPILDECDGLLGTVAISHLRTAKPTPYHVQILETASHLASIAFRRQRFEEQLRLAHEELAHISRLNTMGEMASSFAHELNQPLAAIVNYAFVLERSLAKVSDSNTIRLQLKKMREQALRAGEIVKSVRNMAKRTTATRRSVALNDLVQKSLAMLEPELRQMKVDVRRNLAVSLPNVLVDEIQIQQVLMNLIRNAMEAMHTQPTEHRALYVETCVAGQNEVEVRIGDSGPGLTEDEIENAFEPFMTSKPDGMGMGLTICRSIAERHNGQLAAESEVGKGAVFSLSLPLDSESRL